MANYRFNPFTSNLDDVGDESAGTVTSVSVVTANGLSGTVATATTTPAITLNISALDAAKIANGTVTNTEFQYLDGVTSNIQAQFDAIEAGDVDSVSNSDGTLTISPTTGTVVASRAAITGDVAIAGGSNTSVLATVNSNVGSFGSSTSIPSFTVNAKGLITAASGNAVIAPAGTLTGTTLASNVVTSSLTTIGTLVGGAVPASLVTTGTFGAGAYTFPGALAITGALSGVTTLGLSGQMTSTATGQLFLRSGASTGIQYFLIANTTGSTYFGTESSTGGGIFVGTTAYASVYGSSANVPTQFATNNTVRMTILGDGSVGIGGASVAGFGTSLFAPANDYNVLTIRGNDATNGISTQYYDVGNTAVRGYIGAGPGNGAGIAISDFIMRSQGDLKLLAGGNNTVVTLDTNQDITIAAPPTAGVGATYLCLSTGNIINAGATCAASLREYKENEEPLLHGLETLLKLEPKVFDYKHNGQNAIGFIADDVEQIDKRLVVYTRNLRKEKELESKEPINDLTDIDVRSLLALAIKSIQEQQNIISVLTERINTLANV